MICSSKDLLKNVSCLSTNIHYNVLRFEVHRIVENIKIKQLKTELDFSITTKRLNLGSKTTLSKVVQFSAEVTFKRIKCNNYTFTEYFYQQTTVG